MPTDVTVLSNGTVEYTHLIASARSANINELQKQDTSIAA